jgi:hypothetical protein
MASTGKASRIGRYFCSRAWHPRGFFATRLGWSRHHGFRPEGPRSTRFSPRAGARLYRRHSESDGGDHSRSPTGQVEGSSRVARLMRSADASAEINRLSAALARETDGSKVHEAHAASILWKLWMDVRVRFARRSPSVSGQWPMASRPDRSLADVWPASFAVDQEPASGDDTGECPSQLPVRASRIRDECSAARRGTRSGH